MLTSLAAEKASRQRLRQRLAQSRGFRWWKGRAWGAVAQAEHHPMAKSNPVNETRRARMVRKKMTNWSTWLATGPHVSA